MSRILRRPMFRGGRVDARGTGIASGLGYAKGGSVQNRPGYVTGGAIMAGLGMLGKGALKYAPKMWQGTKNFLMKDPLVASTAGTVKGGAKGIWGLRGKVPTLAALTGSTHYDVLPGDKYSSEGWIGDTWEGGKGLFDDLVGGLNKKAGGREFVGEEAEIVGDPRDLPTEQEKIDEIIARIKAEEEAKRQELIDLMTPKKLTKEEKLDALKEKKEMIRELYPSGRGQDASRMLMNVASKWLEPEATVKSGFGKALGEESKIESKRVKYDDAAAQGAITSFLAGETSFKKFEDELGLYSKKLGMKTKADKATLQDMTIGQHKATISGAGKSDSQLTKAATENYIASQPEDKGKILNTFSSKKDPLEKLEVEENVNEYFIDSDTKHVYKIIIVDGEVTSKRLY